MNAQAANILAFAQNPDAVEVETEVRELLATVKPEPKYKSVISNAVDFECDEGIIALAAMRDAVASTLERHTAGTRSLLDFLDETLREAARRANELVADMDEATQLNDDIMRSAQELVARMKVRRHG